MEPVVTITCPSGIIMEDGTVVPIPRWICDLPPATRALAFRIFEDQAVADHKAGRDVVNRPGLPGPGFLGGNIRKVALIGLAVLGLALLFGGRKSRVS